MDRKAAADVAYQASYLSEDGRRELMEFISHLQTDATTEQRTEAPHIVFEEAI